MKKTKTLLDEYRFPGFRPLAKVKGKFGDNKVRIITMVRCQKKRFVVVVERFTGLSMIEKRGWSEICHVAMLESISRLKYGGSIV